MPAAIDLIRFLSNQGIGLQLHHEFADLLSANDYQPVSCSVFGDPDTLSDCDLLISLGGDGTLLQSVTYAAPKNLPILAVNAGRLGYLSTLQASEFEARWSEIKNGQYRLERRSLLEYSSDDNPFGAYNFALNEFTVTRRDTASMLEIETWLNGEFLNSYWADGLIVSTPTGSTGYSLSCGGPLLLPDARCFIVTPVSPHNLATRPLVIPDDVEMTVHVKGRAENCLVSLDSRSAMVRRQPQIKIRKSSFTASLIKLNGESHIETMRSKLNWGYDVRN